MEFITILIFLIVIVLAFTGFLIPGLLVGGLSGFIILRLNVMGISIGGFIGFMLICILLAVVLVVGSVFLFSGTGSSSSTTPQDDTRFIHDKVCKS